MTRIGEQEEGGEIWPLEEPDKLPAAPEEPIPEREPVTPEKVPAGLVR